MTDRLDPAPHIANARQLRQLAERARAAYEERLVDDAVRLGLERDQAARAKYIAEHGQAAAELQVKRELRIAEQADKAAAVLERKASSGESALSEPEEYREDAARHRARAEIARRRAQAADEEVDTLKRTAFEHQQTVEALEAQLASTEWSTTTELQLDNLEWHAMMADGMARSATRAESLLQRAEEAAARGNTVLAKRLRAQADEEWESINALGEVRSQTPIPVDDAVLGELGIETAPGYLDVPGFPAPAASEPTSMTDPTFEAATTTTSPAASEEGVVATVDGAPDDIVGDEAVATTEPAAAEPKPADAAGAPGAVAEVPEPEGVATDVMPPEVAAAPIAGPEIAPDLIEPEVAEPETIEPDVALSAETDQSLAVDVPLAEVG